jgi:hypothetical protein
VAGRVGGDPGEVRPRGDVLDHDEDVGPAEEDGVDVGKVDREDPVGPRCQQLSPGRADRCPAVDAGDLEIDHMVEAASWLPSPASWPWMRRRVGLDYQPWLSSNLRCRRRGWSACSLRDFAVQPVQEVL